VAAFAHRSLAFSTSTAKANPARLVNNAEWLTKLGAIDFMRDVGKHFTVNAMLAKESV
jgi:tyrosyl-tRNA synthetase